MFRSASREYVHILNTSLVQAIDPGPSLLLRVSGVCVFYVHFKKLGMYFSCASIFVSSTTNTINIKSFFQTPLPPCFRSRNFRRSSCLLPFLLVSLPDRPLLRLSQAYGLTCIHNPTSCTAPTIQYLFRRLASRLPLQRPPREWHDASVGAASDSLATTPSSPRRPIIGHHRQRVRRAFGDFGVSSFPTTNQL